ncbi:MULTISPECIES: IS110 family transposase [unclassified Bacteroides]|uniref:IS110 family transposase n=1 Tax=unclassified Bacteroides TaxID=2646097 RepID=UPI0004E166E1|nr:MULTISPECIES: IS110 family transposase [unclassified Bacteroides]
MKKLFVGIDFSKEKIDVAIIFAEGLTETSMRVSNEFKNSVSGYKQLVKWVEESSNETEPSLWLFCGENTGDYSKPLCNFLYGRGFDMWLENAKSIKDASGIRRLKSDRADANMIAEYAMRNYDKAIIYEPLSESLSQLRELFLYRQMVVRHRCSFQVRRGEKRLNMEKSPVKTMISQSGRHIVTELNKEIEKIDKRIAELIDSDDELAQVFNIVTSIPGIGTQNAVCLMVYTDNFRRFNFDSRKIACYYGIAPFGRDSGTSVHTDPHVHYMANRQIKAMLSQAALSAARFNPVIASYYSRHIAKGKKRQIVLNNVKNKLVHIVTAMVRNKQLFDKDYKISA